MAAPKQKMARPVGPKIAPAALLFLAISYLITCYPSRASFSPLPPQVKSVEGYASLQLTRDGRKLKSRFSYLFLLPDQARIDVSAPFGQTVSRLFVVGEEAFFVLPTKKLYWKASREEVLSKFLGFALSPKEMTDILTGRLKEIDGWSLERDDRGRVVRGRRNGLRFEVRRFWGGGAIPWILAFSSAEDQGSLRIFSLNFNQPLKKDAFRLFFLEEEEYTATTWAEIENLLRHED